MEYYLALRDKQPGDAGVSSALTDLMPMAVIATEQSRDREDFVEAQRLYALIEKADPQHPALRAPEGHDRHRAGRAGASAPSRRS